MTSLTAYRITSLTFGRPAMISKALCGSVPLPETTDDEHVRTDRAVGAPRPADIPSMMGFFVKSAELYEILDDILSSLYSLPATEKHPGDIHDYYEFCCTRPSQGRSLTVFELDHALSLWSLSLPDHLRGESVAVSTDRLFERQSMVLRARSRLSCPKLGSRVTDLVVEIGICISGWSFSGLSSLDTVRRETWPRVILLCLSSARFPTVSRFNALSSASGSHRN